MIAAPPRSTFSPLRTTNRPAIALERPDTLDALPAGVRARVEALQTVPRGPLVEERPRPRAPRAPARYGPKTVVRTCRKCVTTFEYAHPGIGRFRELCFTCKPATR